MAIKHDANCDKYKKWISKLARTTDAVEPPPGLAPLSEHTQSCAQCREFLYRQVLSGTASGALPRPEELESRVNEVLSGVFRPIQEDTPEMPHVDADILSEPDSTEGDEQEPVHIIEDSSSEAAYAELVKHLRDAWNGVQRTGKLLAACDTSAEVLRCVASAITDDKGMGFDRAVLWRVDDRESGRELTPFSVSVRGRSESPELMSDMNLPSFALHYGLPPGDDVLSRRCVDGGGAKVVTESHLADERFRAANKPILSALGPHPFVVAPLRYRDGCLGVLYADKHLRSEAIVSAECEGLTLLTQQAGAIAGRLQANERLESFKRLFEALGRTAARVPGNRDACKRLLVALSENFGFRKMLLFIHDRERRVARAMAARGFAEDLLSLLSFSTGGSEASITCECIVRKEVLFAADAETDERVSDYWRDKLHLAGPLLAVPLRMEDRVCGVLVINDPRVTRRHGEELEPLCSPLASALTIAWQFEKLAKRDQTIKLLADIHKSLARILEDEEGFFQEVGEKLHTIQDAKLCAIYRPAPKNKELTIGPFERQTTKYRRVAAIGYPPDIRADEREPGVGEGAGLTNHMLKGKELYINVPNVPQDPRWSRREQKDIEDAFGLEERALLGVPFLDSNGEVMGGVTLTRPRVSIDDGMGFSDDDIHVVLGIASGISTVLELKRTVQHVRERNSVIGTLLSAIGLEVSVVDTNFEIIYVNEAKRAKFCHDEELVGKHCYEVYERRPSVCLHCPTLRAMENVAFGDTNPVLDSGHVGIPRPGEEYQACVVAKAIVDPRTGKVLGAVEVVRDLTAEGLTPNGRTSLDAAELESGLTNVLDHLTWFSGLDAVVASGREIEVREHLDEAERRIRQCLDAVNVFAETVPPPVPFFRWAPQWYGPHHTGKP